MRIEDHTSGCVADMAVLARKLCFLGKSRSNPLCMGEWVSGWVVGVVWYG